MLNFQKYLLNWGLVNSDEILKVFCLMLYRLSRCIFILVKTSADLLIVNTANSRTIRNFHFTFCVRIFPLPLINRRRSVWVHSKRGRITCAREVRRTPRCIKSTTRDLPRICNLWKYRKLEKTRHKVASRKFHRSIVKKAKIISFLTKINLKDIIFISKKNHSLLRF